MASVSAEYLEQSAVQDIENEYSEQAKQLDEINHSLARLRNDFHKLNIAKTEPMSTEATRTYFKLLSIQGNAALLAKACDRFAKEHKPWKRH